MVCNLVKFQVFFIGFIIQLGLSSSYCHYGEIRLTMENRGRLEICINDEWGTVCPNLWRTTYGRTPNGIANVVCRQLGYSTIAAKYYPLAYYGRGSGRIWLHNVFCTGSESALLNCSHSGIGVQSPYNCDHSEDVSVYCLPKRNTNNGAIILSRNNISSTAYHYGVVRAYYDGWGNICNDGYYGLAEADVICHQLGYTGASSYSNAGQNNYGTDYLQSRLGYLYCRNRNYLSIAQCSYSRNLNDCTHSNDVAVNCYVNRIWNSNPYPGMIRLQGGPHSNIGHVHVYCNGHWGAVCSNGFDNDDADTVCKQLGYDFSFNYGSSVLSAMAFTWSTNMSSTYNDTCFSSSNDCLNHSMSSCSSFATVSCYDESLEISRTATNVTCSLPQDVPTGTIILSRNGVSSVSYYYGIVRVFDNDGWGNICDDGNYGSNEADVMCHQLGYTGASHYSQAGLDTSNGIDNYLPAKWTDVFCDNSTFLSLSQCTYSTTIPSRCTGDYYDVTVNCYFTRIWSNPYAGMIRLSGGSHSNEGRVEVYCNGRWGTICSVSLDSTDYSSICKQLGYNDYSKTSFMTSSGSVSLPTWYDNELPRSGNCLLCPYTSAYTARRFGCGYLHLSCSHNPYFSKLTTTIKTSCVAENTSSYLPNSDGIVRLIDRDNRNGTGLSSGIVQVYWRGGWINIIIYGFGQKEADVICHQLSYTGATNYLTAGDSYYGLDHHVALLSNVNCARNDYLTLMQCTYSTNLNYLDHKNDVAVTCYATRIWDSNPYAGMMRLQDGPYTNEGRVEVYCNGQWGAICHRGFDSTDADTVCKQLGYLGSFGYYLPYLNSNRVFWTADFQSSSTSNCFKSHNSCPSAPVTNCLAAVYIICIQKIHQRNSDAAIGKCKAKPVNVAAIVGGVVGGLFLFFLIIAFICVSVFCACSFKRKRRSHGSHQESSPNTSVRIEFVRHDDDANSNATDTVLGKSPATTNTNKDVVTVTINKRAPPPAYSPIPPTGEHYYKSAEECGEKDLSNYHNIHQEEPPKYSDL